MEIIVAKTAGFCFGVDKAVNSVYKLMENTQLPIYTYGPIIHNAQVVEDLTRKGVRIIEDSSDIDGKGEQDPPGHAVIRAHGVSPEVYRRLKEKNFKITDATCPYVAKIHGVVEKRAQEGYRVIIVGDAKHPEVIGITGWCRGSALVVNSEEEANALEPDERKTFVVAQTTMRKEKWIKINECLKKKFENITSFDTICSATSKRQAEAEDISKEVDMMVVIGSGKSSNTQKLYEICSKNCKHTIKIETPGEMPLVDINKITKIGITAGASTPEWVIREVVKKMSDLNKMDYEMSFKEAFESFDVKLESGKVVKGKIIGFNNMEVFVDLGFKSDGIIQMDEFSDDPSFKPENNLKIGDEIEVFVIRVNDGEGNVLLSKKKVDSLKGMNDIEAAYENKTTITAKVIDVVNGGVIAISNGVRIFVPASQLSDRFVKDLKEFSGSTINLRIVELNRQKRKIVGSARIVIEESRASAAEEFWGKVEKGMVFQGTVKSLMDFGAFVDIGGVDGLVHISELSWNKVKHPSEVLKVGDVVQVHVMDFDREKGRISLGYKKSEDNPWVKAEQKYPVGSTVSGKVVRLVPFGAFVELEPGIDGLVHISQISSLRIAKPGDVLKVGQVVDAKVIEFNLEGKKLGLSIKEISPIDPPNAVMQDGASEEETAEFQSGHLENLSVKMEIPDEAVEDSEIKA